MASPALAGRLDLSRDQLLLQSGHGSFSFLQYKNQCQAYIALVLSSHSSSVPVTEGDFPQEWPRSLDSPLAWTSKDMADERTYTHVLTESELQEIKRGLETFKCECLYQYHA